MDEEQLRAELRGLIAEEVHQQLSQYRGAVSAELKFMDKELETGLKAITGKFNSLGNEIRESHAESVREGITQAQGIVGVWGRALLSGAFLFAGIGAAAWIGIAWTEQQFRWQVTKSAEIAEQIAATENTLDRLNRGSGGLKRRPRLSQAVLPSGRHPLLEGGRGGADMSAPRGMDYLRPFLPGLEAVLEDEDVSEIMINGPGNVWIESRGEIRPHPAPSLDAAALDRAAIQIARPLGLDPATAPILDARLDDGSRVAICVPPAAPHVAITIRRFGKRSYSPEDLVRFGSLPQEVLDAARAALLGRRNILVSGGTGSGKTTLLNALVELLPAADRIVSIEDTLELRIDRKNCVRFEARGIDSKSVTIRDLVRHALRHRPDHIVVGEVRGGEAADLLQALNTGHGGSLTTIHANNAESALSRLATCAMQGETDLPWEVTCRGVVDGISMVIHMTRREGKRYVEEALHVGDYDAARRRWHYRPVVFVDPQLKLAQVR